MGILIFLGGAILGIILGVISTMIYRAKERIHGIVHIDHDTEQCIFNIRSDELMNHQKKIAVFVINHKAEISREEQGL
jgi:hypothetical protein